MHTRIQVEVSRDVRSDLAAVIEAMPAAKLIGLQVIGFGKDGWSRLELPIRNESTFDGKHVQGGIIGMLADFAGVSAAAAAFESGWLASTTGFEVHNLAPAHGERLIAIGECLSPGKSHAVSRVDVYCQNGDRVALVGTATTMCRPFQIGTARA